MWPHAGFHLLVNPIYAKDVLLVCCVLISSFHLLFPAALLDLSGVQEIKGTWMRSTSLPCTYMPSEGFTQQTLIWSMERDQGTSTIFRRDDSGDHVLLSQFRDRVSVPKHSPGDASLLIENLEIPDSGHYTCQVVWRSKNNSLITKEVTTTVKVVKGKSSNKALLLCSQSNPQSMPEKQQLVGILFHTILSTHIQAGCWGILVPCCVSPSSPLMEV